MSDLAAVAPAKLAYSVEEAAAATGISRSALFEDMAAGLLLKRKRGSRTVILATDLIAYLTALPAEETKQ